MENVKNFREFSNGENANLMKKFYEAIDWCIYKKYADFELEDDGPVTDLEVEDDELYCVIKGDEDERYLIEKIMVRFHSYAAADVLFETATDVYPVEDIRNLEELTERMMELNGD